MTINRIKWKCHQYECYTEVEPVDVEDIKPDDFLEMRGQEFLKLHGDLDAVTKDRDELAKENQILRGKNIQANLDLIRKSKIIEELERKIDSYEEDNKKLMSLVDGVYLLVYMHKPKSPGQEIWKRGWLNEAKEYRDLFDI